MNRIQLALTSNDSSSQILTHAAQSQLLPSQSDPLTPFNLFVPLHYEQNYAYPLVVWLHGPNDSERQLQRIMPLISMRNYVGVAPRATCESEYNLPGYYWRQTETDMRLAEQRICDCIEAASQRMNIAAHRVFLAGYDCGGTMAFRIALRRPELFAGILSVGGPFPAGGNPLANIDQARHLPLFIAQGRQSQKYTADRTCEELRLFHSAGLRVNLRQYPCGDEVTTQMLLDMDVWMMEQVTGTKSSPSQETTWRDEWN